MSCFSEEFLNNMLYSISASTHLKDVNTGKYVNSNLINSKVFGLSPAEIVGLTAWDLDSMMGDNWDRSFISTVVEIEQEVINRKTCGYHKQAFLTISGKVRLQNMIKIPIIGKKQKVQQIFTISENLITSLPLNQVWALYKKFYASNIKTGIKNFLLHTGVHQMFSELPTESELAVILANAMHGQPGSKHVAKILNLSSRTIDTHIAHISNKLVQDKVFLFSGLKVNEANY